MKSLFLGRRGPRLIEAELDLGQFLGSPDGFLKHRARPSEPAPCAGWAVAHDAWLVGTRRYVARRV